MFQKVVLYTMLFEVVGLGCGFGPLNNRFFPPMGSILYWLRPNTIRLPPWPNRVPLTKGDARTPVDVAALRGAAGDAGGRAVLRRHRAGPGAGHRRSACCRCGRSGPSSILLALAGLRDKVIFLAARGEVYASLTVAFLFAATAST